MTHSLRIALTIALLPCVAAFGKEVAENTFLYTKPDPASSGGITGVITSPSGKIEQILAMPAAEPEKVYEAKRDPATPGAFSFSGLPPGRYDLVVFFKDAYYEGISLMRDEDTLTDEDRKKIDITLQKSEPFFLSKKIDRVEGVTGRGNEARMLAGYLRSKGSDLMLTTHEGEFKREDHKRTVKLVILKDVGPGWQIVKARNYYPSWVSPGTKMYNHHYAPSLSKIRVADSIKDLGNLDLQDRLQ